MGSLLRPARALPMRRTDRRLFAGGSQRTRGPAELGQYAVVEPAFNRQIARQRTMRRHIVADALDMRDDRGEAGGGGFPLGDVYVRAGKSLLHGVGATVGHATRRGEMATGAEPQQSGGRRSKDPSNAAHARILRGGTLDFKSGVARPKRCTRNC